MIVWEGTFLNHEWRTYQKTNSNRALRDGSFCKRAPRSKLPGCLHLVPPGRKPRGPVYILVSTPAEHRPFEDEGSLPDVAFSAVGCQLQALAKSGRRVRGRKGNAGGATDLSLFTFHFSPFTSYLSLLTRSH
jgi:hypothetical protein